MKRLSIFLLTGLLLMPLTSCTVEQGLQTVADHANSLSTSDSKKVKLVREWYLADFSGSITVGQALNSFLGNPIWQYFMADSGERVVQCNGTCTYNNKQVEAKIQFIVDEDEGTFEVGALAFNDLEQNLLTTQMFLSKAYESAVAE